MSEKVEKLRAMIREEISAALAAGKTEEEKKTLKVQPGSATEDEVERALEAMEAEDKKLKCPNPKCDYSAAEEFNPCPKCGSKIRWKDAT